MSKTLNYKLLLQILVIVVGFYLIGGFGFIGGYIERLQASYEETPENINITLKPPELYPTLSEIDFNIPQKYLGPKFLELSKKNMLGGRQESFLIEFSYPSMQPINDINEQSNILYASVSSGIIYSPRKIIEHNVENENSWYEPTDIICNLQKYEQVKKVWSGQTIYHYFDKDDLLKDINFFCSDRYCRMSMVSQLGVPNDLVLVIIVNGIDKKNICDWQSISVKTRDLIRNYIIIGGEGNAD